MLLFLCVDDRVEIDLSILEKDTKQQQKCDPFETEDHKEGLEYTMMHTNFH